MSCSPAMSRLVGLLVLVVALLQGMGLEPCNRTTCCADQRHASDGPPICPPDCASRPCCARAAFPPIALALLVVEPSREAISFFQHGLDRLPAPPPRGILHVPRLAA